MTPLTKTVLEYEEKYGRITDGKWPKKAIIKVHTLAGSKTPGHIPMRLGGRSKPSQEIFKKMYWIFDHELEPLLKQQYPVGKVALMLNEKYDLGYAITPDILYSNIRKRGFKFKHQHKNEKGENYY